MSINKNKFEKNCNDSHTNLNTHMHTKTFGDSAKDNLPLQKNQYRL